MRARLSGAVVATTREGDPNDPLTEALRAEGAEVRVWPTLCFLAPSESGPLETALDRLSTFAWVAFTSPRAVSAVAGGHPWKGGSARVAAVGEGTADALRGAAWPVHVVGEGDGAVGMARAMSAADNLRGRRVLFLAGSLARPELERALTGAGAHVHRVEAYRTQVITPDPDEVRAGLAEGVAAVLFASPSAVAGLSQAVEGALAAALEGTTAVAIGATTASALEAAGIRRMVVAKESSIRGLVEACVRVVNGN